MSKVDYYPLLNYPPVTINCVEGRIFVCTQWPYATMDTRAPLLVIRREVRGKGNKIRNFEEIIVCSEIVLSRFWIKFLPATKRGNQRRSGLIVAIVNPDVIMWTINRIARDRFRGTVQQWVTLLSIHIEWHDVQSNQVLFRFYQVPIEVKEHVRTLLEHLRENLNSGRRWLHAFRVTANT